MLFTAFEPPSLPLLLAASAVGGALLLPWLLALPRLALLSLFISLLVGQLIRVPLPGQSGGLLLSDVATVVVLVSAVLQKFSPPARGGDQEGVGASYWLLVTSPFIFYSLWTNLIHWSPNQSENLIALAYWARLSATLLLLPALLSLLSPPLTKGREGVGSLRRFTHYSLLVTSLTLCLLGFIQWWFLPDLSFLARYGWDPHQGRLVSTWLDPNLLGGFLLIVIPVFLPLNKGEIKRGWKWVTHYSLLVTLLLSLLLTKSRSSLIALALTALIFSPLLSRKLASKPAAPAIALATAGLVIATSLVAIFFLGDRARGLLTVDITAQLRLESLQAALPLASEHLFTGVGYNRYQFAAKSAGLIDNFSLHSRAGADNSLLTLLITTGLPGLLLFLLPWAVITHQLIKKRALPALFSMTALLIHSQFVNSLLYSHLLIALIIVVALVLSTPFSPLRRGSTRQKPGVGVIKAQRVNNPSAAFGGTSPSLGEEKI